MEKDTSVRMTVQRQIILEVLQEEKNHPTADDVYAKVRLRLPRISLGTVYRNLELLASQGIIRKLDTVGSQRRFDFNPKSHHHVRCIKCGALEDIPWDLAMREEDLPGLAKGYKITGIRIELLGVCPKCGGDR